MSHYWRLKPVKSRAVLPIQNCLFHIRAMKKFSFKKRFIIFFLLFAIPVIIFYILTNSKLVCVEIFLKSQVDNVCRKYMAGEAAGDFCPILCSSDEVTEFSCLSRTSGQSSFLARWKNQQIVIRTTSDVPTNQFVEPLTWHDAQGDNHYPTDDEFTRMIQRAAFFRYNMSLPVEKIQAMTRFSTGANRAAQIDDMWQLVQHNDYLMGTVFAAQEIFPEVFGTCGPLFAIEHLNPLIREMGRGMMSLSDWKSRIKAAVLILDYLKELDANAQDPIKLCNVKFNNFGISGNKLMKYNDLKSVYLESYLDAMMANGKVCLQDSHCNVQQCKSACDTKAQKCMEKQLNNNLQIVCDKGTPHWPGLLNSNRTPKSLQLILDDCIHPEEYTGHSSTRRLSTPVEMRERLYDELTRVYEDALMNSGF